MEGYGGGGSGTAGGSSGYPQPAARTSSNRGFADPGYATSNGMLSRSSAAGSLPREDSMQNLANNTGSNSSSRTQQANHEVFMVRQASTGPVPLGASSDRSSFASSGNRFQDESSGSSGGDRVGERSHHARSSEKDLSKSTSFVMPKMLKIAVVGNSTSGKTAICNAFTSESYSFSRNYHMTTGVSIYAKSIKLPSSKNSSAAPNAAGSEDSLEPRINLVLVDSAGKPIYRELLPQYWDRLDGLALVIDLTSSTALETASEWANLAKGCIASSGERSGENQTRRGSIPPTDGSGDRNTKGEQSTLGVLIGNKNDLKDQRVISPKAAQDFASRHGLQYFECSAKENSGIEEPFFFLAHQWSTKFPGSGSSSGGSLLQKENLERDEGLSSSSTSGVRISGGGSRNNGGGSSTTGTSNRKSGLQSRQNSSSEAF